MVTVAAAEVAGADRLAVMEALCTALCPAHPNQRFSVRSNCGKLRTPVTDMSRKLDHEKCPKVNSSLMRNKLHYLRKVMLLY